MQTPALSRGTSSFYLLRHGQSEANVRGLIASSLAAAREGFGLTDLGRAQVRDAVTSARAEALLPRGCHVISSPLLRARESAVIAADVLGASVRIDARLAERGFGEFELASDDNYGRIWKEDRADPAHQQWGVESTSAILARVTGLLHELHEADDAGTFLLCTHGDVASVLLCASAGLSLVQHRDVGAMGNGEVRRLPVETLAGLSRFQRE